jgi:ribosomal protein S18 acetylase RimI-like enzyme
MDILNASSSSQQGMMPKHSQPIRFGSGLPANISVINAASGDVYALNRLYKGYVEGAGKPFSEDQTIAYIQELLKNPKSTLLLAYYAGRAIGYIHAVEEINATSLQKELYTKDLYVEPQHRDLGAAESLLKRIDELANNLKLAGA